MYLKNKIERMERELQNLNGAILRSDSRDDDDGLSGIREEEEEEEEAITEGALRKRLWRMCKKDSKG